MHEQRPPTSPGAQPAAPPPRINPQQPQRLHPPQPSSGAAHAQHAPHASPTLQPAARLVMRPSASQALTSSLPLDEDDDLVVLDDALPLDGDGVATAPKPVAGAALGSAATAPAPKKITFGAENTVRTHQWKRKPTSSGTGACRVKTFHGKCSDQGMEYLDDAINVFLDGHPDIEVKFVQSNVAMFDGKFKDFALIVNLWY